MAEIIPAIMPKKWGDIEWSVEQVVGLAKVVQIDIMDGKFVKNVSWPYGADDAASYTKILGEEQGMPLWEEIDYELDLMIADVGAEFDNLMKLAPKRIVLHIEAMPEMKAFLENMEPYFREHVEWGVAINTTTDIAAIADIIPLVSFVQCMGIEKIGYQGQPFDKRVLNQIDRLRKEYPALTISVDGGVNHETAPLLIDAGADRLVIGSAVFKSADIRETMLEFKSL